MKQMIQWSLISLLLGMLGACSSADDGMLKISSDPGDAEIYIDGDRKGNTPAKKGQTYAIKLSEGDYTIEIIKPIESPGKYDQYYASKKVFLAEKTLQTVSLALERRQTLGYKKKWDVEQQRIAEQKAKKDRRKAKAKAKEDRRKAKAKAKEDRRKVKAKAKYLAKSLASIQMNIVSIPSGSFQMGSNAGESNEKPVHTVHISSFKMGKYEVTQAQWEGVMGNNPSSSVRMNNPVENVSWNNAQNFIKKLNQLTGKIFRLPSEAEWEYAARAGSSSRWSWGNNENAASTYAWYRNNSGYTSHSVGQKKPNSFGLYDMYGNVCEWLQDSWHDSYRGAPSDGSVWGGGNDRYRVRRGGGYAAGAEYSGSASRDYLRPGKRDGTIGFRLAR